MHEPKATEDETSPYKKREERRDWIRLLVEGLTLLAVVFYGYMAVRQWREQISARHQVERSVIQATRAADDADQALKDQRAFFQLDQRPYVVTDGFLIRDFDTGKMEPPTIGKPIEVDILIRNAGKSPALKLKIHRHLVFGNAVFSMVRPEPPDYGSETGGILAQGEKGQVTTALSLRDTFANETADIKPSQILNWDGSAPIMIFGRISYQDTAGNVYCTPYIAAYINPTNWLDVTELPYPKNVIRPPHHPVTDLCPKTKSY